MDKYMRWMIAICVLVYFGVLVPFFMGAMLRGILKLPMESVLEQVLLGLLPEGAIFYLLAEILVYSGFAFSTLTYSFWGITLAVVLCSGIWLRSRVFVCVKKSIAEFCEKSLADKLVLAAAAVFIILVALLVRPVEGGNLIPYANLAIESNQMYTMDPYTGRVYEQLPEASHAPLAMFYAVMAYSAGILPSTMVLLMVPLVLLHLYLKLYVVLARELFESSIEKQRTFVACVSGLYLFLSFTGAGSGWNVIRNCWQGDTLFCNMLLPGLMIVAMRWIKGKQKRCYMICMVFLFGLCAMLLSEFGLFYISMAYLCATVVAVIRRRYSQWKAG